MNGHISVYKAKFGKNWIVDLDNGTRERPGRNREGFTTWGNAHQAVTAHLDSWKLRQEGDYSTRRMAERIHAEHAEHVRLRIEAHHASSPAQTIIGTERHGSVYVGVVRRRREVICTCGHPGHLIEAEARDCMTAMASAIGLRIKLAEPSLVG